MKLAALTDTILDETSTPDQLCSVLHEFSQLCRHAGGIAPDISFDAWAEDSFLGSGVAINPQAAAHCVTDYQRTVVFLRGINAALVELLERFPEEPIKILYAGCGPYATLLLPLLDRFDPDRLDVTLIDYHQQSLDSVDCLIGYFGYRNYKIQLHQADACRYQHGELLHLVVAEIMQKALEQEPQFEVTANLAPQLSSAGFFIPEKIEVELCLAKLEQELEIFRRDGVVDGLSLIRIGSRVSLGAVLILLPQNAATIAKTATFNQDTGKRELASTLINIPHGLNADGFNMVLFTRIQVFGQHQLSDFEAEITLPLRFSQRADICAGRRCAVTYELGSYPKFNVTMI